MSSLARPGAATGAPPSPRTRGRAPLAALLSLLALTVAVLCGTAAEAGAAPIPPCFTELPGLAGIPPWGFHTSEPLSTDQGWYSRAYGEIDLDSGTISGRICQAHYTRGRLGVVMLAAISPLLFHSHVAQMWGYPGNEVITHVRVTSSTDRTCAVGTVGRMTMFASYDGVREDSVDYRFPAPCAHEDHLYQGPQVDAQVPPL